MNKLVLYLMNKKGLNTLNKIIKNQQQHLIKYVVSSEDKSIEKDFYMEIKNVCIKNKIIFYNRKEKDIKKYKGYKLAIGWRWLIKDNDKLIVLHDSLLPKYRGFSPLVNMLLNKEKKIGVTALFATEKYDCGDIIEQKSIEINYPIKIKDAIEKISLCYIEIVEIIIKKLGNSLEIEGKKQVETNASYSMWRDNNDYYIDWKKSAEQIKNEVDVLGNPYTNAKTYLNNKKIKIKEVCILEDVNIENRKENIGKVIFLEDGKPVVITGSQLIKIIEAEYLEEKKSIFPLNKFRIKFGGQNDKF